MSVSVHCRLSGRFGKFIGISVVSAFAFASAPLAADDLFEPLPAGQTQSAPAQAWPDSPASSVPSAAGDAAATPVVTPAEPAPVAAPADQGDVARDAAPNAPAMEAGLSDDLFEEVPIYDRQAVEKLQAERSVTAEPHPLMLQFPDDFTVVCEAGCSEADAEIVYRERKDARGPVTEPGEKIKALPIEAARNVVQCVGGCYLGERVYGATADAMAVGVPSEDTSWLGTRDAAGPAAKPIDRKNDTSGRWFDRIGG